MPKELPIPPQALRVTAASEFVRGWIVDKALYCSLNISSHGDDEPVFWGIFLSDIARHVADALHAERLAPGENDFRDQTGL